MAFGRPTKEVGACPRCDELRNGAKPRKGWGVSRKEMDRKAIRKHKCGESCGTVCTFGEW